MVGRSWKRFTEIAADEGPGSALRAATRRALELTPLYYWYRPLIARFDPNRVAPWDVIWIDPADVEWSYKRTAHHGDSGAVVDFDDTRDAGRIVGGDWDRRLRVKYEDLPKVEAVHEHFGNGVPWEETGLFDHLMDLIDERGRFDGCECYEDLRDRYRRIDRLYDDVVENGYRSRDELCDGFDYDCRLDVPKIHVARDGTLVHAGGSGNHRIAIGQVLDVPVEARVVVRHREWERLREEIRTADSLAELSDRARANLAHPDVEALVPNSWHPSATRLEPSTPR